MKFFNVAMIMACTAVHSVAAQGSAEPGQVRIVAVEVMRAARYATLTTIGADGQPQSRVIDPLVSAGPSVWFATNPLSRKVQEIQRDPRVTLLFFNPAGNEYVTVLGRAAVVTDSAEKARHWKAEWARIYKQEYRGADFMLFEVHPFRIEMSASARGQRNDPATWRPVIVDIPTAPGLPRPN